MLISSVSTYQRGIVLVAVYNVELLGQAKYVGIGDVYTIQKGQKVHDTQKRHHMEVNFRDELPFSGVRRALNKIRSIVIVGIVRGSCWVLELLIFF